MSESLSWNQRPFTAILRLVWPIAVSMLSYSAMTLADTVFVSGMGAGALAGLGLASVTLFTVLCFAVGLLRAVQILVAQSVGARNTRAAAGTMSAGLILGLCLAVLSVVVVELAAPLVRLLSPSAEAGGHAVVYMRIRVLGAPAFLFFVALREASYGHGHARAPMIASMVASMVNIALDYVLVVFFDAGVAGVAWASVLATFVEAGLLITVRRRQVWTAPRPSRAEIAAVWRLGVPTGLHYLLEVGAFTLITVLIAAMSEVEMAAHQLVLPILRFAFLPANAMAEAGAVLAGQAVGARRPDLVVGVGLRAAALALCYAMLWAFICLVFGPLLVSGLADDAALAGTAGALIQVTALFLVADSAYVVVRGVLRGTGDVRYAAAIGITMAWTLTPPLTWLLGYALELGAAGAWLALCVETVIGTVLLWRRLLRGTWRRLAHPAAME